MKYIYIFFFVLISFNSNSSIKNAIKLKLENTNNINFNFVQKIENKIEKGNCTISYPKKIYCKYDDIFEKVLVSNGRSLIINSKKITNYLRYNLKDTPLNMILDKEFLINKIKEINEVEENEEIYFIKINHNNNLITLFFNKVSYDLKGWTTTDIYQNKVETLLLNIQTNLMIDEKIFRVQKYIN
tara:strand:- start:305 stop:859 length:555 start_codon:yes stop_codon:yes gene_type:complete